MLFFIDFNKYIGSSFDNILKLLKIKFCSKIEHVFLSIQKFPLFSLLITLKKLFSSKKSIFLLNFFLIFEILIRLEKKYNLPLSVIMALQFARGLLGKSLPLIFKSQHKFSLLLIYR